MAPGCINFLKVKAIFINRRTTITNVKTSRMPIIQHLRFGITKTPKKKNRTVPNHNVTKRI